MEKSNRTRSISGSHSCLVCFRPMDLIAVGECEHPICYVCSTKLRVVCNQKECPVCRHTLSDVIISSSSEPYSKLKRQTYIHDEVRYQMRFENREVKAQYLELLKKQCPICNNKFSSFPHLREHMKKAHDKFYCDICVDHLKIFHTERKFYDKADLDLHNTQGDENDSSHKGHPLCQFCYVRYLNDDELFKHTRKTHYFCFICEKRGQNVFFSIYEEMRRHFQRSHFVCSMGECSKEEFPPVFSTRKELKEHEKEMHVREVRGAACAAKVYERPYSIGGANNNTASQSRNYEVTGTSREGIVQEKRKKSNFLDGLFASGYFGDEPYYIGNDRLEVDIEPQEQFPSLGAPSRKPKGSCGSGTSSTSRGAFRQNDSQALNSRSEFPPLVPGGGNANPQVAKAWGSAGGCNKKDSNVKSSSTGKAGNVKGGKRQENNVKAGITQGGGNFGKNSKKGNKHGKENKGSSSSLPDGFSDAFNNGVSVSDGTASSGYIRPRYFNERNQALMACVKEGLQNNKTKFDQFVKVSKTFRDNKLSAVQYFNTCWEILGDEGMSVVMGELICLLPDIIKQTRLMRACKEMVHGVIVCMFCNQVMDERDKGDHEAVHAGISDYM